MSKKPPQMDTDGHRSKVNEHGVLEPTETVKVPGLPAWIIAEFELSEHQGLWYYGYRFAAGESAASGPAKIEGPKWQTREACLDAALAQARRFFKPQPAVVKILDLQLAGEPGRAVATLPKGTPELVSGTWDGARRWRDAAVRMEQGKLFCQVMLGFELLALRNTLNVEHGKKTDCSQIGNSADNWVELLEKELRLSRTSAYRMMEMADAAKPRLKKLPELAGFDPCAQAIADLPEPAQAALLTAVRKLTDGATQVEFMREVGLAKLAPGAGATGRKPGEGGRPPAGTIAEQAALAQRVARADLTAIACALEGFADKFTLLDDGDCRALESVCERHLKAVRQWLAQPAADRDPHTVAKLFDR